MAVGLCTMATMHEATTASPQPYQVVDPTHPTDPGDARYLGLAARDARFDGLFFVGVTSTGIYCRPICRVRTPLQRNCLFFNLAAQAEQAGFRPCLRCRPELAPQSRPWSTHDAGSVLLNQAVQWLQQADAARATTGGPVSTVAALAARLGVSDRHLRRLFQTGLGVSPLQYLQTQRLLTAKQLLTDTRMSMSDVAEASGFGSVRRFNDALKTHYQLTPGAMRRTRVGLNSPAQQVQTLAYRPPFDVHGLLTFLQIRALAGVEHIDLPGRSITRTLSWASPTPGAPSHTGWIQVFFDDSRPLVRLEISQGLGRCLPAITRQVRHWLDLDAEPVALTATLGRSFPDAAGVRLPGCVDSFELATRAVLGHDTTVETANQLAARLTQTLGSTIETPWPMLNRLSPTPDQVLQTPAAIFDQLGIRGQCQQALKALAHGVLHGGLALNASANAQATEAALVALPGVGSPARSEVLMRALHWPDAFPVDDQSLQKALGTFGQPHAPEATEERVKAWQPWRSYAAMCLWRGSALQK